ncbi:serine hydrolase domain-containing protein [Paraflavitalea pollutisoli]|uniref:serine hydrolase domain-containing protein n=1 Tax=Paraflavitalea pollutisoli TaxID=3034143 RepID=UPI0023ECF825|nr:serine hydrolase domain-containing protein [Paraflavitalea sp. H1-2-19X]
MKKLLLLLLTPLGLLAQSLPDSTVNKINGIFSFFAAGNRPGCAVAIARHGQVVFSKGYGLANLEYNIPNTANTIFHIASESKQYVAFCMLLLEKEGKLSLDDDIRKYLEYVPDFGKKITIRHLIYHTSGLRDQWQLLANAGWQLDDVITQEHVIKLIAKQQALNFTPGDEWMYCNTGYTLMAEIVKKVSGLSLRDYTQKNIFEPLGMKDTHFHDNYTEIVPGRSYSYNLRGDGKYQHAVLSYSIVGATSLFTTVLDELKWVNNLNTGTVGGKDLVEKMLQPGVLNDGRKLNYAFALNLGKYKGWQQIGHGGSDAGYRTYACRFPEQGWEIVVFSNYGMANPVGFTNQIADLLLGASKPEPKDEEVYITDSVALKRFVGKYYGERGDRLELFFKEGKLYRRSPEAVVQLADKGNDRYKMATGGVIIAGKQSWQGDSLLHWQVETANGVLSFQRQPAVAQPVTEEFTGRYYNEETEAYYTIGFNAGKLTLGHRKFANADLTYIAPDQFTGPHWWMSHIRFIRDKRNKIIAFEVNAGRVQHLRYGKVK